MGTKIKIGLCVLIHVVLIVMLFIWLSYGKSFSEVIAYDKSDVTYVSHDIAVKQGDEIEAQSQVVEEVEVYENISAKTYMHYEKITDTSSDQYKLINESGEVEVCDDGFLRDDEYIGVALGEHFGPVGTKYEFHMSNGNVQKLIKVEEKADDDTDENNFMADDGSVIEYVIDETKLEDKRAENGYIYSGNFNNVEKLSGIIETVYIVE